MDAPVISVPHFDLRNWLAQHTPVYLLSAMCMLGSCVLLANDTNGKSVSVTQILCLVLTLTVYQGSMFALAALLMLKRGVFRDGRMLLVLDAVFFCDVTFANSNLITANLALGLTLTLVLLAFSATRVWWLSRKLGAPLPLHLFLSILAPLVMLVAFPAWLKHLDDGQRVAPRTLYALWWVLSIVGGACILAQHRWQQRGGVSPAPAGTRWFAPVYLLIAWVSLLAHVGFLHYVYDQTFYMAMAAPPLLVCAMLSRRLALQRKWSLELWPALPWTLIILATVLGLNGPHQLGIPAVIAGRVALSPPMLTLVATYLVVVYLYLLRYALAYILGALGVGLLYLFGPSWHQAGSVIALIWRALSKVVSTIFPKTRFAWGIIGIIASFLLLGLGAMISLRKPPDATARAPRNISPAPAAPPEPPVPTSLKTSNAPESSQEPIPPVPMP